MSNTTATFFATYDHDDDVYAVVSHDEDGHTTLCSHDTVESATECAEYREEMYRGEYPQKCVDEITGATLNTDGTMYRS